jgi:hypothetical protein
MDEIPKIDVLSAKAVQILGTLIASTAGRGAEEIKPLSSES